jgi:hypothetical protein
MRKIHGQLGFWNGQQDLPLALGAVDITGKRELSIMQQHTAGSCPFERK